ncbi:glycine cleavage T C-terminal barrel domain-containing protein [Actinomyces sp. ZJ308]|uniref:CAF17-like 4Fe-4S cluster assembly/insertion protein YgfZ n=1 Tax=Actinomyces sp. ZJ308 TaxID=2708342 RepID=UPI001422FC05|nr:glycine cleavage T C-terminal barrel domain-containing protein [Actinomyces sp. ZJ308]
MLPSPLLNRPGAVASAPGDPDEAVPAHLGDPGREQAALAEGRATCALARDVVAVTGQDRLSWLTTLSSQVLTALEPGDGGVETLLLDAQGHITHALAALDDGRTLWLVTEAGGGADLAAFLDSMRFMLRVEVAERPDVAALGALGEGLDALAQAARDTAPPAAGAQTDAGDAVEATDATEATEAAGAEVQGSLIGLWRDPWPGVVEGGTSYDVGLERPHPGEGYRAGFVLVPTSGVGAVARTFLAAGTNRRLAGALAWEALRVEAGRPRRAREADARAIPHEMDWLRTAVHLTKGCYPGQETIARTLNLGRPPRRLTVLQLDGLGGDLPRPGAVVRMGERTVGAVTSVARHHELGPIALALLRRAVPVGEQLTVEITEVDEGTGETVAVGRVDAAQEPLVSPEGRAQASPSERPGAELRKGLRL